MRYVENVIVVCMSIFSLFAIGCGDAHPKLVPVSGTVVIDGVPLSKGSIQFTPKGGRSSLGAIDKDGHFTLSTFEPGDGCIPGRHRVVVYAFEEISANARRWMVPKEYADPSTSKLTAAIDNPTDALVINLTWGDAAGPYVERFDGGSED